MDIAGIGVGSASILVSDGTDKAMEQVQLALFKKQLQAEEHNKLQLLQAAAPQTQSADPSSPLGQNIDIRV